MNPSAVQPPPALRPPAPPRWALAAVEDARPQSVDGCVARSAGEVALVSTTIDDAASLDAVALRDAVADAYRRLFAAVDATAARHVVRAWNFVSDILGPMADGGDRYMSFNAGRYDAMLARFGRDALAASVPSGTGVGHAGGDLAIHLLATTTPGVAVENPRQTPAYRYSPRYGPLPPCFARATRARLPGGPRLLVAGTAAIRGEATLHEHDFDAQLRLTIDNLCAVLASDVAPAAGEAMIERFESLRAYAPAVADVDAVRRSLPRCEIVPVAALCRPDLLIEIEGVARTREVTSEATR